MQEINFFICPSKKSLRNVQNQIKIKKVLKNFFFDLYIVAAAIQGQTQKIKNDSIEFEQSSEWKTERKKALLDLLRSTEKK